LNKKFSLKKDQKYPKKNNDNNKNKGKEGEKLPVRHGEF
jgi:hypothetical protein